MSTGIMMRFCPNCETERPVAEYFCEGEVAGQRCNWNMMEVPFRQAGWRPAVVVPAEVVVASTPIVCVNGHDMEDGDLLCGVCGEDIAPSVEERSAAAVHTQGTPPASGASDAAEATPQQESSETVIAGWRVLRQISNTVGLRDRYLVEEMQGDRRGVLTLYHHGAEPDPAVYDALRRVALEHVPSIFATGRWNDRAFEVAEELTGGTLADLGIVAGDPAAIRRIVYELGKALDALAEVGLRHRDIRPGTLLVRHRDPLDLVIGGFGSARLSEADLDIVSPLEITRYTAPEAVAGGVAAASDWWSLGIVLLEQITRGACFDGINQHAFLIHVLADGVPLPDNLPDDIDLLLRGLLARDRQRRWKLAEVKSWLDGGSPPAPGRATEAASTQARGPSISLGGRPYFSGHAYALAAAEPQNWQQAVEHLTRGSLATWAQEAGFPPAMLAGLRRMTKQESLDDDLRLLVALKLLNPEMPPVHKGAIVTPKWLLDHPLEGYDLITGPVPDLLEELAAAENWLQRLKARADAVRHRAHNLAIDLDEDTLRINLLSTSRARLATEWEERRTLLPDTEHVGLLNLIERRTFGEEDLIVILSAGISQFRSCEAIVEEAKALALAHGVHQFESEAAREMVRWPRGEILQAVGERIEGFARCSNSTVNAWADQFRLEKRTPLARALVLLAVPQQQWQEPQKQQYVSQILDFFEKKVVASVMRGPLVRLTIGKTTPRVDLAELGTMRVAAAALLDHMLERNARVVAIDPAAFDRPEGSPSNRLQALERASQLYRRDTGIDGMYLGFPFLLVREARAGATTRIAPLLLWPVRLHHEVGARAKVTLAFDSDREEVRVNPALDALVGVEPAKAFRQAAAELLGRSSLRAADVMDAFGTLAQPKSRELVALPGPKTQIPPRSAEMACAAVLFHVTFSGQAIGEDIRLLKAMPPAGTGLETALRVSTPTTPSAPAARPREIDRYFTAPSDPSQEEAVFRARTVPGLLVEGPPGTGKSQTIVNMVGDAIGQRRSLLIVCQKHAALEVVHKRLVAEGLGDRLVMVNDVNRDRLPIIRSVREQLEKLASRTSDPVTQVRRQREVAAARIESLEASLDRHHAALHEHDPKVGLSYRELLADLIGLEDGSAPPDVPALRPVLEPLNIGELAAIEEEVAPLVRYWLPARYEGSALSSLQPFAADRATLLEFKQAFDAFVKLEGVRTDVLLTRQASFEVDDPSPHKAWLQAYAPELLGLSDIQRTLLARWLPLFRATGGAVAPGVGLIDELRRIREALGVCRTQDQDEKLSSVLPRVETTKLVALRALATEAVTPAGFLAKLNPFRAMRRKQVARFLEGAGDTATPARMQSLIAAAALEQQWRPLRAALATVLKRLSLPDVEPTAGAALLPTTKAALTSLEHVAGLAAHLATAPWPQRMDQAAALGTKEAVLKLFAEFDSAFARFEARRDSARALGRIKDWFVPDWVAQCGEGIGRNEPNAARTKPIEAAMSTLAPYQAFRSRAEKLSPGARRVFSVLREKEEVLKGIGSTELDSAIRRVLAREARLGWKRSIEQRVPDLALEREELEAKVRALEQQDGEMRRLNQALLKDDFDVTNVRPLREWEDITRLSGQRSRRLREFIDLGAGLGLMKLRPIWLMNPDVASRVLPLKAAIFDTVIYDEASQMPVEYAVPSLFRARISVVSGDEKQMPPTAFFSSRVESDEALDFDGDLPPEDATEEEREGFDETWNRREIKDCPDLLQLARTSLPNSSLQIHYRSAYRELIGYSNAAFYRNDLSVPVRHPEATVLAAKPIEMIRVDGVYREQTNQDEAAKVVELLAEIWTKPYEDRPSVGVVTFNRKQADLIEEQIEARAEADPQFAEAYRLESERNEGGEDMGVFVKNVENVQGDERDVIIFSSTFGRNGQGSFLRNFGVLGQRGGERRLNVAVTRSRKKIVMVTSMPIPLISDVLTTRRPPSSPRDFLQGYMEYARAVSAGEFDASRALLARMSDGPVGRRGPGTHGAHDAFSKVVESYLRSLQHEVKVSAEEDAFGLDFAIEHPTTGLFAIGIECDAPRHQLLANARARDVWRASVLKRAIPVIHRVSSVAWYHDGERERQRLRDAVASALS
jgi:primosomal replication protein N''